MGEIQRHHVTHHLSPELRDILRTLAVAPLAPAADTPDTPADDAPLIEPWTFHDPRQQCDVVAYLDPQNQIRHVPTNRTTDVPKTWRQVYIDAPSGTTA